MSRKSIFAVVVVCGLVTASTAFAQGGAGGGSGGAAGGSAGSSGAIGGSAGTGQTSTGLGQTTGSSAINTNSNANVNDAISPANPSSAAPGGPNAQPVPQGTVTSQDPQTFDPRLSPGYQK
ncbi:hypothetical protein BH10PSE10_BH10PSE10_11490 [soil metagenome]